MSASGHTVGDLAVALPSRIGDSRTLAAGAITLAAAMLLPPWVIAANSSYMAMVGAALLAGIAVASVEEEGDRRICVSLLVWSLAIRTIVLTIGVALASHEGGPFLGPDSTLYYYASNDLATDGFHLGTWPAIYFGTYDVGQYYLFASAVRFAHADLFGLQMLNCALTGVAVPFAYGVSRILVPRGAVWIGLLVAVHPSLIGLSAIDLLKDPSIVCAVLGLLWVLVRLSQSERLTSILLLSAAGLVFSSYLRVSRFYAFAYIEAALVLAVALSLFGRRRPFRRTLALGCVLAVFAVVEIVPTRAMWPLSPVMFVAMAGHTLNTPGMRFSAPGLYSRVQRRQRPTNGVVGEEAVGPGLLNLAVNAFRRTFGPYPWILPARWNFRALQDGQFYFLPGMLIWYGLLPLILLGFVRIGAKGWTSAEQPFGLLLLWFFAAIYFAQYLLINLSYRQREAMVPVLLVFGWVGFEKVRSSPALSRSRWYLWYWAAIAAVAALHLTARAILHA